MKKILFAIAIVLTLGLNANAQRGTDGLFANYENNLRGTGDAFGDMNSITPGHGLQTDNLPLGSGLLILTALGAGYAVARKKSKK